MSKNLNDFFNKFPGLDMIENPRNKKKKEKKVVKTVSVEIKPEIECSNLDIYKNHIIKLLSNFTVPISSENRYDPLINLLEAGYYQFLKHNSFEDTDILVNDKSIDIPTEFTDNDTLVISEVLNDIVEKISTNN